MRNSVLYNEAKNFAEDRFEIVYSIEDFGRFVEVRGEIGGDMMTYRVYPGGMITQR